MPRQTYVSSKFFVNICEQQAKQQILTLPLFFKNFHFIGEDNIRHSLKFFFQPVGEREYSRCVLNVAILSLSTNQAMVSLNVSNEDGASFYKDDLLSNAVSNFELAVLAAINGNLQHLQLIELKTKKTLFPFNFFGVLAIVAGLACAIGFWL